MTARKRTPASPWNGARVELVPVHEITIDARYQREKVNMHRVRGWCQHPNIAAFGVLLVVLRDDMTYACVDGQHRLHMAIAMQWDVVPCLIVTAPELEDEARVFIDANDRETVTALARFHARLTAGDEQAIRLREAVHDAELFIGARPRDHEDADSHRYISAVTKLESLANRYGFEHLTRTLLVMSIAWHGDCYSAVMMHATAQVLSVFAPDSARADDIDIARRLGRKSPRTIELTAGQTAQMSPRLSDYVQAIVKTYNASAGDAGARWNGDALTRTDEGVEV